MALKLIDVALTELSCSSVFNEALRMFPPVGPLSFQYWVEANDSLVLTGVGDSKDCRWRHESSDR